MSFHHKSALAHICTFVLIGGGWFSYMPWAIGRGIPFPEVAIVGAGCYFSAMVYFTFIFERFVVRIALFVSDQKCTVPA